MKIDNSGQISGELILLMGGILLITIIISSYITYITNSTENNLKQVITKERDYILNKL